MENYKFTLNVTDEVLPRFYIFKNEILIDNHIKLYKPNTHMEMQKKVWMIYFCSKSFYLSSKGLF